MMKVAYPTPVFFSFPGGVLLQKARWLPARPFPMKESLVVGVEVYPCVAAPWLSLTPLEQATALAVARAVGRRMAFHEATVIPCKGSWRSVDLTDYSLAVGARVQLASEEAVLDARYRACVEGYLDTWSWLLDRASRATRQALPGVYALALR